MNWSPQEEKLWAEVVKLAKEFFPRYKIVIQRRKLTKAYGRVHKNGRTAFIFIDKSLPFDLSVYTLAEELAHIRAGIKGNFRADHNAEWGKWYAYYMTALTDIPLTQTPSRA